MPEPTYVIVRVLVSLPIFFAAFGVMIWATLKDRPNFSAAGWAATFFVLAGLGIIER
jgi:hypothetical protein